MTAQPLFIYATYPAISSVTSSDWFGDNAPGNVLKAEEDNVWQPLNTTGSKSLTFDLTVAQTYGCLALIGENLNGVTFSVYASSDDFNASNVQVVPPTVISEFISCWAAWNNASYRYWRITFSGFGPSFVLAHAAFCQYALLPFFMDGVDPGAYQTEGSVLVSPDGHFLGSNRLRSMLTLALDWGLVDPVTEFPLFQLWAAACIKSMSAFFLVPDSSQPDCYFSWVDPKFLFRAPWSTGLRSMPTIPITARNP